MFIGPPESIRSLVDLGIDELHQYLQDNPNETINRNTLPPELLERLRHKSLSEIGVLSWMANAVIIIANKSKNDAKSYLEMSPQLVVNIWRTQENLLSQTQKQKIAQEIRDLQKRLNEIA